MDNESLDKRKQNYALRKSILDYGMGFFIFAFGIFLLAAPKFGVKLGFDNGTLYIFSGMFMIYGAWRFYRGYKKNYFN